MKRRPTAVEQSRQQIDLVASDGRSATSVPVAITVTNDPSDDGVSESILFGLVFRWVRSQPRNTIQIPGTTKQGAVFLIVMRC